MSLPSVTGSQTHSWRWWTLHHHLSCELTSQFLLKDPLSGYCNMPKVHIGSIFLTFVGCACVVPAEISQCLSSRRAVIAVSSSQLMPLSSSTSCKRPVWNYSTSNFKKIIKILTTQWGKHNEFSLSEEDRSLYSLSCLRSGLHIEFQSRSTLACIIS